jgi:hypothetical protein
MSLEDDILVQRLKRAEEIEALGFRAYGQRFDFTHTIPNILREYSEKTAEDLVEKPVVKIAGRIQTMRRMGKAGFLHLMQAGEKLQVYIRKDGVSETESKLYEMLDTGDIIGVEGYLFRTRTGELSVHAEKLTFLSKILLALPEKFHGLEDVEVRYRQRYLDLIANPDDRESRVAEGFRDAREDHCVAAEATRTARLHRGRDADDAASLRGRDRSPVRHASQYAQYARYGFVFADRAGALFEAADRGRARSGVRNQSQLSERGDFDES